MISKKKAWILAARPKTLPASIGPVLLGTSLVAHEQIIKSLPIAVLTLLTAVLLQIGTNLVNDYYDSKRGVDDQNRIGPDRALQKGWLKPSELKKGIIFIFCLAFTLGLFLMFHGGWPIIVIGLLSIFAAFAYTGGPLPLSYYALGEILAFIFFGPIPVWGTYYLLSGQFDLFPALVGFIPGFVSLSLMGINNLRDNKNDKTKGKTTLATLFGEKCGRLLILGGILGSSLIPLVLFIEFRHIIFLLAAISFLVFFKTWKNIAYGPVDQNLNNNLASTGKYLFINCLLCAIGFFTI